MDILKERAKDPNATNIQEEDDNNKDIFIKERSLKVDTQKEDEKKGCCSKCAIIISILILTALLVCAGLFVYFKVLHAEVEEEEEFFTDSDFDSTSYGEPVTVYMDPHGCRIHPRETPEPVVEEEEELFPAS